MTLDSVIVPWRSGESSEAIQEDYPSVPLADIYGAVAYYLEHHDEVEQYLHDTEQLWLKLSTKQETQHGAFLTEPRHRFADVR